jgi:sortase B
MDRKKRNGAQDNRQRRKHAHSSGQKKKTQGGKKTFHVVSTIVLLAAVCVFVFSAYQLIMMLAPYYVGGKEYDEIKELAITTDDKGKGFSVDFDALLKENPDTVAWIRFDEPSVISYPVVKSKDNEEYLTKTFTANDNKLGAIFMDMRSNSSFSDRNTFIYGHHLNSGGEMFSKLNEYEEESFCKEHPYFYIYTPDGKTRTYQVFMAGVIKDTAENYTMMYATEEDYVKYLETCRESSNYTVDVELNAQSKVVSLSTCTNVRDDERFLVQGVLVEETGGE